MDDCRGMNEKGPPRERNAAGLTPVRVITDSVGALKGLFRYVPTEPGVVTVPLL